MVNLSIERLNRACDVGLLLCFNLNKAMYVSYANSCYLTIYFTFPLQNTICILYLHQELVILDIWLRIISGLKGARKKVDGRRLIKMFFRRALS